MLIRSLLSLLFPPYCVGCHRFGLSICKDCQNNLQPTIQDVCPYCYRTSTWGTTHVGCSQKMGLDGALACLRYNKTTKKIISRIKYTLETHAFSNIAPSIPEHWWRMDEYAKHLGGDLALQPIPLHKKRYQARGFNQADIICSFLSKKYHIPMVGDLIRIKNTRPQAREASRSSRRENIRGAFKIKEPKSETGKTIIIVDDLFTSGSTAKEAARVLKENGVHQVYLYTLAHGG